MKTRAILASIVFLGFCLFSGSPQSAAYLPTKKDGRTTKTKKQSDSDSDRRLAEAIKGVTNRSTDGLREQYAPGGGMMLHLDGRFQNAMVARLAADGEAESACITDIGEANAFFGRNLETGALLPRTEFPKSKASATAERHGMSEQEFNFYSELIRNAELHRAASPSSATMTIQVGDGATEGFNDPNPAFVVGEGGNMGTTIGQQRLNVFSYAAAIWGAFLDSNVTTTINATFDPLACSSGSAVLGSAGANNYFRDFPGAIVAGTWYPDALTNKLFGANADPATGEIVARFNSSIDTGCFAPGHRFYYGLDGATPASRTNLLMVVLHEMGHGLGFATLTNGSTGAMALGFPDIYARFIYDRTVGKTWSEMATNAERQASAINNGNVFWDGPNVKIASGSLTNGREVSTGRVQLYTPVTFSSGSSVSHFDTSASPNLLMEPNLNSGLATDGDLTRQQLRDIGWYRDTTADVVADTITNVAPAGGVLIIGEAVDITWTNSGGLNGNVTIELSTDGGSTYPTTIASNVANTGSYFWTVPNSPTVQARIRVREADFAAPAGTSSANFAISLAPAAAGVPVSGRVTGRNGFGVSRATVRLQGTDGAVMTALTNSFGYFRFDNVLVGRTYEASATSRRFRFELRLITVNDELSGLDFVALP